MRRLSAGGVPLLLMCYFLSAALCSTTTNTFTTSTPSSSTSKSPSSNSMTGESIVNQIVACHHMRPIAIAIEIEKEGKKEKMSN